MGCLISTNSAAQPALATPRIPTSAVGSKSPPPVDEEIAVKKVLSQTPAIPTRGERTFLHQARKTAAALRHDDPSDVESEIYITHSTGSYSTQNDAALHRPKRNSDAKRGKPAGRSPPRRSDTSPGRVNPGSGSRNKSLVGEDSRRRPRSPVIHSNTGSSKTGPNTRKAGNSPGRVVFGSGERNRKGGREDSPPTTNELLESSLVSLECFIFL